MWSCDGPACKDVGEGTFPEKSRCLIIRASWKHRVTKREEEKRKRERGERGENEKVVRIVLWKGTDVSTMRTGESATETFVAIVSSPRKHLPRPRYFYIKHCRYPCKIRRQ